MNTPEQLEDIELQVLHYRASQEIDRRSGSVDSYAAPHVWNLVAKILREQYPDTMENATEVLQERRVIEDIALVFAKRFAEDDGFDPVAWLDKCSPNRDLYPFSEMWDEE